MNLGLNWVGWLLYGRFLDILAADQQSIYTRFLASVCFLATNRLLRGAVLHCFVNYHGRLHRFFLNCNFLLGYLLFANLLIFEILTNLKILINKIAILWLLINLIQILLDLGCIGHHGIKG